MAGPINLKLLTDFFNKIDPERTSSAAEHAPVSRQQSEHEPALAM